jgi:uncharacterized protein
MQQEGQRKKALLLYLKECLRLFVWLYFKPFTLERWLRTLPPVTLQPSRVRHVLGLFAVPAQWRSFLNQVRWVMTIVSLLIGLVGGLCLALFSSSSFPWQTWLLVELCFGICIWFSALLQSKIWSPVLIGVLIGLIWLMIRDSGLISTILVSIIYGSFIGIYINSIIFSFHSESKKIELLALGWALAGAGALVGTWALAGAWTLALALALASALVLVSAGMWALAWAGAWVLALTLVETSAGTMIGTNNVAIFLLVVPPFIYVWLFECLWACVLYALSRQGQQASWLRYLPYYLDEVGGLPLPFMASLIVEAYQDDSVLAKQTIEYLNTSTNQQRLIAQVTRDIALNQLARCQTTIEIASVADHLDWIPSPAPKGLGTLLPPLLEASQGVRVALSASSRTRQALLLKSQATTLRNLQSGLSFSTSRETRIIGRIAQQWMNVVETAQKITEKQAEREGEVPQVYVAGSALDPDKSGKLFKGRSDLFREIETLVLTPQPPILFLYGDRRTGKTSALKYLPKHLGPEFVPLLVDLQSAAAMTTLAGLAENLAKKIQEAAREARAIKLPEPNFGALRREPFLALETWFESLERRVPGKRFVLCLDEFERLDSVLTTTGSHAPLHFLRHLFQHHPRWIVLFSGAHTPEELPAYWSDYLINTRALSVSYLEEPEARALILHPVEDFPQVYDEETVDKVLELTNCHPYLIQLLCSVLVDHLNRTRQRRATPEDVGQVLPQVFMEGSMFFREFWQSLTLEQQRVTTLLVQGKQANSQQEKETIRSLVHRDIIQPWQEGYRFQVPLYGLYIKQRETTMD